MTTAAQLTGHAIAPSAPRAPGAIALHRSAVAVEATFLTVMLKATGAFEPRNAFGGGAGEGAFADFRLRFVAEDIAAKGSTGLAKAIIASLRRQDDEPSRTAI